MSIEFKKCLYILVDRRRDGDSNRYNCIKDKAIVITMQNLNEKENKMRSDRKNIANISILGWLQLYKEKNEEFKKCNKAQVIIEQVYKKNGIKIEEGNAIDTLTAYEDIVSEAIENQGVDFICIDSLNGLVGDSRRLNRSVLNRITQKAEDNNVTLLCIHHTNRSEKLAGDSSIMEKFEYVYRLSEDNSCKLSENDFALFLDEEKAQYSKRKSFRLKGSFGKGINPDYTLLEQCNYINRILPFNRRKNLTDIITEKLMGWTEETITFEQLKDMLGRNPSYDDKSIKNCLKTIADRGFIQMINSTWKEIKILR
jgi:hypothetical protein